MNKTIKTYDDLCAERDRLKGVHAVHKGGWITRMAVPFVVRNYSSHMFADKGKKLLVKIGSLLKRRRHEEVNGVQ